MRGGSGLNLTQELTSLVGRHVSLPPCCQAQRRHQSQPSSSKRGGSGHSPSWAHEFSQVEGEGMRMHADPAPTICQASQTAGSSQVSRMKILVGKNHPDPSLQMGASRLTCSDLPSYTDSAEGRFGTKMCLTPGQYTRGQVSGNFGFLFTRE